MKGMHKQYVDEKIVKATFLGSFFALAAPDRNRAVQRAGESFWPPGWRGILAGVSRLWRLSSMEGRRGRWVFPAQASPRYFPFKANPHCNTITNTNSLVYVVVHICICASFNCSRIDQGAIARTLSLECRFGGGDSGGIEVVSCWTAKWCLRTCVIPTYLFYFIWQFVAIPALMTLVRGAFVGYFGPVLLVFLALTVDCIKLVELLCHSHILFLCRMAKITPHEQSSKTETSGLFGGWSLELGHFPRLLHDFPP